MRSAGSRSGVNWMRTAVSPRELASVEIVRSWRAGDASTGRRGEQSHEQPVDQFFPADDDAMTSGNVRESFRGSGGGRR
jgi:hypothetical protein